MSVPRRFFAPEVLQTSSMDCGPAALKCLLEGLEVPCNYGRLREACQTSVDGTSIDALEEVARELGVDVEQVLLPMDHVVGSGTGDLPSIVVVRRRGQFNHFVVIWRRLGEWVQIMDPAVGRRWVHRREILRDLYAHAQPVPWDAAERWFRAPGFVRPLRERMRAIGIGARAVTQRVERARAGSLRNLLVLDAAVRAVTRVVSSGALERGAAAARAVDALAARELAAETWPAVIAPSFFAALPAGEQLVAFGTVVLRARGTRPSARADLHGPDTRPLVDAATIAREDPKPLRHLAALLRADGLLAPAIVATCATFGAIALLAEAVVLRGLFHVGAALSTTPDRAAAIALFVLFAACMLVLEFSLQSAQLRLGRRLELRLRAEWFRKVPRVAAAYFRSRASSDLAERAHALDRVAAVPVVAARILRSAVGLVSTTLGVAWLEPRAVLPVLMLIVTVLGVSFGSQVVMSERDLRVRTYEASLARHHLDALLALVPIRAHRAERAVRREHEGLLSDWLRTGRSAQHFAVGVDAFVALVGVAFVLAILGQYLAYARDASAALLLVWWVAQVPSLASVFARAIRAYPAVRNVAARVLELLDAPEEPSTASVPRGQEVGAVELELRGVSVTAGGHRVLEAIDARITAGEHVAIVGASGAGKSTLVGLFLDGPGPSEGSVLADGAPLESEARGRLRRDTVWIDPAVHLWNASVLANVRFGSEGEPDLDHARILGEADLHEVIERLPRGLRSNVGDSGALLSGGEGQRLRFGRALARRHARLVVLDEPFRGLPRDRRRLLLARVRGAWPDATTLLVSHDIEETLELDRVLVMEDGRVVEDGSRQRLAASPASRYRAMLEAERDVRRRVWRAPEWRRLVVGDGRVHELPAVQREGSHEVVIEAES